MEIVCPTCQRLFHQSREFAADGVQCPHCGAPVVLTEEELDDRRLNLRSLFDNTISGMGSLVFHLTVVLLIGLLSFGGGGLPGEGDDVLIGSLPGSGLSDSAGGMEFTADGALESMAEDSAEMELEIAPVEAVSSDTAFEVSPTSASLSAAGSGGGTGFSAGMGGSATGGGGGGGGSGGWDQMIQQLRRDGLDIVIVFDSTSSMGGEIDEVKSQIQRIGETLVKLVPKTRISVCTYRDDAASDGYDAKGLPLTSDIVEIRKYLSGITANGGGDIPEAVEAGLQWAVENNDFRQGSRKVILLFGDAPPHREDVETAVGIASAFHIRQKGIVSTVTCRNEMPLDEFASIAQAGGGEAFLTSDERQIMTQLVILVFGSRHRDKVLESFELLGR
ncbi:MAG TPA: vWA domain-containing protein [Pirellulaceae bacterium]|nr:vWA domain-containing protein [Pirellulaceae bacterium]